MIYKFWKDKQCCLIRTTGKNEDGLFSYLELYLKDSVIWNFVYTTNEKWIFLVSVKENDEEPLLIYKNLYSQFNFNDKSIYFKFKNKDWNKLTVDNVAILEPVSEIVLNGIEETLEKTFTIPDDIFYENIGFSQLNSI